MNNQHSTPVFVAMLYLKDLAAGIAFYTNAFGAKERWRVGNGDSVHVTELEVGGALIRMHEESPASGHLSPATLGGSSIVIHLLVDNPDELMTNAVASGATATSPMRDYEYGFRQGSIVDPFGHHWCLERKDDVYKIPKMS